MKLSSIRVTLTEKDIYEIVQEYLDIDNLNIEKITLNELIEIEGTYEKGANIPFYVMGGISSIVGNTVYVKILKVKIAKVPMAAMVVSAALKGMLKDYEEDGITIDKDNLIIDLELIAKVVPYFNFKLKKLTILEGQLEAEVEDIVYAPHKKKVVLGKKKSEKSIINPEDSYHKLRGKIGKKIPGKYEKVMKYAMIIPDIIALFWRLLRDKRVEMGVKATIIGITSYLVLPIDIIPDFIPFIGQIDDVALTFFGLKKIMDKVPKEILLQNWEGESDIFALVDEGVDYLYALLGGENISKLLRVLSSITTSKKEKKA